MMRSGINGMNREYHKWHSPRLDRAMELLVFGHTGLPAIVFPTSGGRFYEFEDQGMVAALGAKIEAGQLQLYCVDSVNMESWYDRNAPPRRRIARHMQFEQYVINEVVPLVHHKNLVRHKNSDARVMAAGCSFGGYHAVNIALRHPELFTGCVSLSGAFDLTGFLGGYYDQDCYYHLPTHYLPQLTDREYLDRYARCRYVLATGWDDQCLAQNQQLDRILMEKGIAHEFYIWNAQNSHDWPTWQRMAQLYL
jgi:esterase/lipase superfamily enzyme